MNASPTARTLTLLTALALVLGAPPLQAAEHTVNISGTSFVPADLDVEVGDTVTWVNDGGLHNVNALDASFTSGPPSTDMWTFSHTFNEGGVYDYQCDEHVALGMTGTVTVEGIFGDGLESGDTEAWSSVEPVFPSCNCYFSPDCPNELPFCDWGNLTQEDICTWRENKPTKPGTGCDLPHFGDWTAGICDGICAPAESGSIVGREDPAVVAQGARLWAEALLIPAEAGGGPVDPKLAEQATSLPFSSDTAAIVLGRQIADLLIVAGIPEFYEHFCDYEAHAGHQDPGKFVDLSNDLCRSKAAWMAVDALLAELETPGSGRQMLDELPLFCSGWRSMFEPRCPAGPDALDCLGRRIADTAVYLTTPAGMPVRLDPAR